MGANFGFLLFDGFEDLDFIGPWEIIGHWSQHYQGPQQRLVISEKAGHVVSAKGLRVVSDYNFSQSPALDYLLIPGGQGTRTEVYNSQLIQYIQQQAKHCQQVLSVCTGSLLLQAADLLKGKKATTH